MTGNARWRLNPDRGWRNGRFGWARYVGDTIRDLWHLAHGRAWHRGYRR